MIKFFGYDNKYLITWKWKRKKQHWTEELFVGFARVVVISVRSGIKRQCNRTGEKRLGSSHSSSSQTNKNRPARNRHIYWIVVCVCVRESIYTFGTFKRPFWFSFVELFFSFLASLFDALKYFPCCLNVFCFIHFCQSNCTQCSISWKQPSMREQASQ